MMSIIKFGLNPDIITLVSGIWTAGTPIAR